MASNDYHFVTTWRVIATPEEITDVLGDAANLLTGRGAEVTRVDDELHVTGLEAPAVGDLLFKHGLALHELTLVRSSIEDSFMTLTADSVEYLATSEGVLR